MQVLSIDKKRILFRPAKPKIKRIDKLVTKARRLRIIIENNHRSAIRSSNM